MTLLRFMEYVDTECGNGQNGILSIKAIKIDGQTSESLKAIVGCPGLKSCDYLKRKRGILYFIENSDLKREYENLIRQVQNDREVHNKMKKDLRIKLSESLLIFERCVERFNIERNKIKKKIAILCLCCCGRNDIVAFDFIRRSLESAYTPKNYDQIIVLYYEDLIDFLR